MKNPPKVLVIEKASPGHDETFGDGGHACYHDWFHGHIHMSKIIKLYTLNVCSISHVNYVLGSQVSKSGKLGILKLSLECVGMSVSSTSPYVIGTQHFN